MMLLDTNVVSEPMRPSPSQRVVDWLDAQAVETLFISAITVAELRYGVACLPLGRRRDLLAERIESDVLPAFAGRVLVFDLPASQAFAELMATAKTVGIGVSVADGLIAAIAKANGHVLASRDESPFTRLGLRVVNPWE